MDNPYQTPGQASGTAALPPDGHGVEDQAQERRRWLADESRLVTAGLALGTVISITILKLLWTLFTSGVGFSTYRLGYLFGTLGMYGLGLATAEALVHLRSSARVLSSLIIVSFVIVFVRTCVRLSHGFADIPAPHRAQQLLLIELPQLILEAVVVVRLSWIVWRPASTHILSSGHRVLVRATPAITSERPWQRDPFMIVWVLWLIVIRAVVEHSMR